MAILKGKRVGKFVVRRKGKKPLIETDPERCEQAVKMYKDGVPRREIYNQLHIGQYALNRVLVDMGVE